MGRRYKLPLETGFSALLGHVKQIGKTAELAGSAVSDLADATVEGFREVEGQLDEKQEKGTAVKVNLSVGKWVFAEEESQYRYDITVEGVTARDRADIMIEPDSMPGAVACGMSAVTETLDGIIRVRASRLPTEDIAAEYWVSGGKE